MDTVKGWTFYGRSRLHPKSNPANSETLSSTSNENQERHNSPSVLQGIEEGVNYMLMVSRIVSEANARGKAAGYADGNTTTWKV